MNKLIGFIAIAAGSLISHVASAAPQVAGTCRLEGTQESIIVTSVDPDTHFGKFAEAISSKGDYVYLTTNFQGRIDINVTSRSGAAGYSIVPINENGPTTINYGLYLPASRAHKRTTGEWLSCELEVVL